MSAPSVTSGRSGELADNAGRQKRAQVGKAAQGLAQLQQARFGAAIRGKGIELVAAHCAQQHGVAFERGVECRCGQRRAASGDGRAADQGIR